MTSDKLKDDFGILSPEEYRAMTVNKRKAQEIRRVEIDETFHQSSDCVIETENGYPAFYIVNGQSYKIDSVSSNFVLREILEELGEREAENIGFFTYVGDYLVRFMKIDGEWQVQDTRYMPEIKAVEA